MNLKYAIISTTIMVLVLILTIFGQPKYKVKQKTIIKKNDISKVMSKPVFESTYNSLNTKVWIISQAKNRKVMKTTNQSILTGTHYFIFDLTDAV